MSPNQLGMKTVFFVSYRVVIRAGGLKTPEVSRTAAMSDEGQTTDSKMTITDPQ